MLELKNNQALVISSYGKKTQITIDQKTRVIVNRRRNVSLPVAGDVVEYQSLNHQELVITDLVKRHNYLSRHHKPVAANIDYLLLVVALYPCYQLELIDRYLITAKQQGIAIKILVNKIDLKHDADQLKSDFQPFTDIGYCVHYLSLLEQLNTHWLLADMSGQTYLVVGQSGVGKSSLVNYLLPEHQLKTQALSNNQLGKHTTSNTILYPINHGAIIDSPGVRELDLNHLTKTDIMSGFREISALSSSCKFRNCTHINEPECCVKIAVKSNIINLRRYQSYCRLMLDLTK